jgi:hypothetical protein
MRFTSIVLSVALFLAFAPAVPARAADLQALHKTFAGYTYDAGQLKSSIATDTVTYGQKNQPFQKGAVRRVGLVYRRDIVDAHSRFSTSTGFNGEKFWFSNANGFTVPVIGDSAKRLLAEDLILTDAIASIPWTPRGPSSVDGHTVGVYRIAKDPGYTIDLYVDDTTGQYRRAVIDPDGSNRAILDILQYTPVNGMLIVSQWHSELEDTTHTLSDIAINPIVSDPDLSPPPQVATWDSISGTVFPIKIIHRHIAVEAKINGVQGLFVLGSGSTGTLIGGQFAHRAGLKADGYAPQIYQELPNHVQSGTTDTIEIGGSVLRNAHIYFGAQDADDLIPDGVLGYDIFAHTVVTIDFVKNTMQIQDPALVDPDAVQGVHMLADLGRGKAIVPAKIQDVGVPAVLETGVPAAVLLPYGMADHDGLKLYNDNQAPDAVVLPHAWADENGAIAETTGGRCWQLEVVTLGPISYTRPTACIYIGLEDGQAVIGLDFLDRFEKIVFDFSRAGVIFVPRTSTST